MVKGNFFSFNAFLMESRIEPFNIIGQIPSKSVIICCFRGLQKLDFD